MNQTNKAWTPETPWAIEGTGFDEGGHCHRGNCDIVYKHGYVDLDRNLAKLIVQAVNSHDDLLEACWAFLTWEAEEENTNNPTPEQAERYMAMIQKAVDAIAKAEGNKP